MPLDRETRRIAARSLACALLVALLVPAVGCSFLLPRTQRRAEIEWQSFEDAKSAYDRIEEDRTSAEEIRALGFEPMVTPNVRSLSYLELIRALVPIGPLTREDLPEPIRRCIAARDQCRGVAVEVSVRRTKRLGFWVLDVLGFWRQERTRGWDFSASLVLVSDVVVYKTWRGTPDVNQYSSRIRPLGPLQEPFEFLMTLFGP